MPGQSVMAAPSSMLNKFSTYVYREASRASVFLLLNMVSTKL